MQNLLEKLDEAEDFSDADAKELEAVLGNKSVLRALACIMREGQSKATALLSANLGSEQGRMDAVKTQGISLGLVRAVQILEDLTKEVS